MTSPPTLTLKLFAQRLVESRLMTTDEILAFRQAFPPDARPATADAMAAALVAQRKLTPYQVGCLMEGRTDCLVLGNNVILDKIGEGGMGEVLKARHRHMRRVVCVKILRPNLVHSESAVKRFRREWEAAAQLSHPNIVTAFDAAEERGVHYLVMEFVDGPNLGVRAKGRGLPWQQVVDYVTQAARGLDYAHSRGVIHRDIKPGNLLLDASGVVKILDLGLARFEAGGEERPTDMVGAEGEHLTRDNQIVGTVEYMSPEQADDSVEVDRRADIYSLGCTLHCLLIGRAPYRADAPLKVLMAHRVREIPSLRAERPEIPERLEAVYRRMMAKRPDERYQTMAEVIADLAPLLPAGAQEAARDSERRVEPRSETSSGVSPTRTLTLERPAPLERSGGAEGSGGRESSGDSDAIDSAPAAPLRDPQAAGASRAGRHPAVGIDLGTTFSVVAHLDSGGRPQAIVNSEGDVTTPSVVLFDGDEVVVGKEAVKAMAIEMENIADCSKRELGRRSFHKALRGREYPPEVLEAMILNKLRVDAQRVIGPFTKVVVTVPAYFDETRRKQTQDAGYMAGFEVMDIINEPTAAALTFAYQRGALQPDSRFESVERVLVYDLGGGTFDVTVMEIRGREFVTLATDGDVQLGGRDWDQRLIDYAAELFMKAHGVDPRREPNALGRLWRDCEDARRTLSARQKTQIVCDFQGRSLKVEVTRQLLQELTFDLLERTAFTTRQTMQAAGLEFSQLDRLLLVGGATRMPAVGEMLRKLTGREPDNSVAPDEAVAQGAALQAGLLLAKHHGEPPQFKIRNVNSHSLGVVGTDKKTGRRQNAIVIPRNTPLPAEARRVFLTQKPGQTSLLLQIVEGESTAAEECAPIGRCTIRGLPPNLPERTPVEVRFHYAENGRLTVTVQVAGASRPLAQEIVREHALAAAEMDEWRRRICDLPAPLSGRPT